MPEEFTKESVLVDSPFPKCPINSKYFKFRSYSDWAGEEIFRYIDEHPEVSTLTAIENFKWMMDRFVEEAKTEDSRYIFSVARNEADYILDCYIYSRQFEKN